MAGFEKLGQILPRVVRRSKSADNLLALQVRENFTNSLNSTFVGKKLPKITAGKFAFGVLTVLVPDPAWSNLLRVKEAAILKKLNAPFRKQIVQKLRFKVVAK